MKDLTLTHSAGEITWRAYGEAFGRMVVDTGIAPVSTIATVNNLRFPGQLEDQETGTFYNYFRDYDPATGRYIESDPIGLSGGTNTYGYVDDNPLNYVDPDGKVGLAGCIAASLIAYGAYKVWDKYSCQRECQLECYLKFGCATGNCPTDDGENRALTICTRGCVGKCWGGPGKKGPMGPTPTSPPNHSPITK